MITIDKEFKKEIGSRLRTLRNKNKLTLNMLAEKMQSEYYIDIDEKSLRRYENGEFLPKIDNLICFAELYNTSIDYIVFGKDTSDDNSLTYYDNFKRLNRLVYSLSVNLVKNSETGRCYLALWEDEFNLYWERINTYALNNDYSFQVRGDNPYFTIKDLDNLFDDFKKYKEQLIPSKARFDEMLKSEGINPDEYLKHELEKLDKKRV